MKLTLIGLAMGTLAVVSAHAQGFKPTTVVRTIPGMQCMALAAEFGAQGSYAPPAPEYAGPEAGARQIGIGAGTILVRDPMRIVDGRTEVLRPNGQNAWIEARLLTRWHALSAPGATCRAVLLSNGRYGFDTSS